MGLSNAERQRRYINRLKAQAKASADVEALKADVRQLRKQQRAAGKLEGAIYDAYCASSAAWTGWKCRRATSALWSRRSALVRTSLPSSGSRKPSGKPPGRNAGRRLAKREAYNKAHPFTAAEEARYTSMVKKRRLYEGACDLDGRIISPSVRHTRASHSPRTMSDIWASGRRAR